MGVTVPGSSLKTMAAEKAVSAAAAASVPSGVDSELDERGPITCPACVESGTSTDGILGVEEGEEEES